MSTTKTRLSHHLLAPTAAALCLLSGASVALSDTLTWTGSCGPSWFSACNPGQCQGGGQQYINNFGQVSCFSPVFPTLADTVLLGSNAVQIDSNASAASIALDAGGTINWSNGYIQSPSITSAGTLSFTGGTRSIYGTTLTSNGTFNSNAGSDLRFETLAFVNNGALNFSQGNWISWSGSNSVTSTGSISKVGPLSAALINLPVSISGSLHINQGSLTFQGGSVALGSSSTISASPAAAVYFQGLTLSGTMTGSPIGTIALIGGTTLASGGLTANLGGTGLQWQDGPLSGNGLSLTNSSGGLLTMTGGTRSIYSTTFSNQGLLIYDTTSDFRFETCAFTNSGTVNATSGNWYNWSGGNAITNTGTFRKTTADTFQLINLAMTNSGVIAGDGGLLNITGDSLSLAAAGSFTVAGGATVNLQGVTINGTLNSSPTGMLSVNGGWALSGPLACNVSGTGLQWQDGPLFGGGNSLTNAQGATLTLTGGTRSIYSTTVVNNGAFNSNAPSDLRFETTSLSNSGSINWSAGNWLNWSGGNSMTNTGTITKSTESSVTTTVQLTTAGPFIVNGGSVTLSGTTLRTSPGSTFTIAPSKTLALTGMTLNGDIVSNTGSGGFFGVTGNWAIENADGAQVTLRAAGDGFSWTGVPLFLQGRTLTNAAASTFTITGGTRSAYGGSINNAGVLNYNAASDLRFETLSMNNTGTINMTTGNWISWSGSNAFSNSGTFNKNGTDPAALFGLPVTNSGTINVYAGSLRVTGSLSSQPGSLVSVGSTASMTMDGITTTGTLTGSNQGTFLINGPWALGAGGLTTAIDGNGLQFDTAPLFLQGQTLINAPAGILSLTGGARSIYSGAIANQGILTYSAADLRFETLALNNTGSTRIVAGNWLNWSGSNSITNSGTIALTGTAASTNVPFTNSGIIDAGAGTFTIASLSQQPAGTLAMTVGTPGGQPDSVSNGRIVFNSPVTLAGTLRITRDDTYALHPGDSFVVITGPSIIGTFSALDGPAGLTVTYAPGSVTVTVTLCGADFNGDGFVNSDDLSDFITGYFNQPADPRCDFNADGILNSDDLSDYITAYFNGCV